MIQSKYKKNRWLLVSLAVLTTILTNDSLDFAKAAQTHTTDKPAWLSNEPLVLVGNWDSTAIFRRRKGTMPTWSRADYARAHTEEAVKKLKEFGATMALIHFFKGFGLEAEKEQLEDSKKLAALCKKHGIRVGVYVGSTIGYETFLLEKPEAKEWFVPDYLGKPVMYGNQTFRKRVYFMHPGYIDYIKRVLRIAIEDLKVDWIHFDNTSLRARKEIFFHPMAIEDFRKFLRNKYTPKMLKERLGFSDVTYVEPPKVTGEMRTIDDPLLQEWADFRCKQLADFYGEMRKFIRGLNPEVAIDNNPHSGLSGCNTIWEQGVDYPGLLEHTDIVWSEEGNRAEITPENILTSKIRTYKMAAILGNKVFTYTSNNIIGMAEAMAYNRQCMGMVGGLLVGFELSEKREDVGFDNPYTWGVYSKDFEMTQAKANYIKFYHKNFEYYRDIDNIADVAVLHSFATMGFNNDGPYQSTYLFEQALIQAKVPFDVIFDKHLKDLSKYRVLVLADQQCLSDEQSELIKNFVRNGGGLVATDYTSLYTPWRRPKLDFGLKELFGIRLPKKLPQPFARGPERVLEIDIVRNEIGKGKVAYISEVKPVTKKPPAAPMSSKYWKLPENWEQLVELVKWAAGNELSAEFKAPLTVTMELTKSKDKNSLMLHLINYDAAQNPLVEDIEVSLKIPQGKKPQQIMVLSPDRDKNAILDFVIEKQRINFTIPRLEIYNLLVIKLN